MYQEGYVEAKDLFKIRPFNWNYTLHRIGFQIYNSFIFSDVGDGRHCEKSPVTKMESKNIFQPTHAQPLEKMTEPIEG